MNNHEIAEQLKKAINEVFVGKEEVVEDILICLIAGGHVLLEDVPGVGKTTLAKTVARAAGLQLGRIQCTPDTLPGDIIGVSVYNMKTGEFEYREGAIMCQILLADEINRTSPKTQASLLEAMAEAKVTVDGVGHELMSPFMVIATQNPVEYLGTYPLPEAQMDRFMMRLTIGYPTQEQEMKMVRQHMQKKTSDTISKVCGSEEIRSLQNALSTVQVKDNVLQYMEDIVTQTRNEESFVLGASPRGLLDLVKASLAKAFLEGRDYVKPDDVRAVAEKVLRHRIVLTSQARVSGENAASILQKLVMRVKLPLG